MTTEALTEAFLKRYKLPADIDRVRIWDRSLAGYGAIVGKRFTSFVVQHRVNGAQQLVTIGRHGAPGAGEGHGEVWTETRARRRAMQLLGQMSSGVEPVPSRPGDGPTLRVALEYHLGKMQRGENRRGKACSPRSIQTMRREIEGHFATWLDRPIVELTADAIEDVLLKVERDTERLAGSNPANPPGRALRNRLLVEVGTVWRSWHKRHGLPVLNPTERLQVAALKPRDTRIADDGFAAWHKKVLAMKNEVRRDLQLAGLFSGLRSESLRTLRWDEVDFDEDMIQVERAKSDRPFTIPLTSTLREILERRQADNAIEFAAHGGDHGFVFPSLTRNRPFRVIAVAEVKEREFDEDGERVTALPGIHASRRTYNSVAIEVECPQEIREALLNHAGRGVNVRSYGRPQRWDHLAEWATKIEAALWSRIRGEGKPKRGRVTLHAA